MNFTIDDVKRALNAAPPDISTAGIIHKDEFVSSSGKVPFAIHLGWDLIIANLCDNSWGAFNITLLRHIRKLAEGGADIGPILENAQLEDQHWKWLDKSMFYRGDNYNWFFLVAEGYPQAACLIYHPKKSVVVPGDIFYVEYIAAAPWNRVNALADRVFKGVGPLLLNRVIDYSKSTLGLRSGFSLHSLPKAVRFYEKIGMTPFPAYDKDGLAFFEWVAQEEAKS